MALRYCRVDPSIYLVNYPAHEELRSTLSMPMEVEGHSCVTANTKVIVHRQHLKEGVVYAQSYKKFF